VRPSVDGPGAGSQIASLRGKQLTEQVVVVMGASTGIGRLAAMISPREI